eukprot:10932_1
MIYLLYISWLFITQAANDCYYGWFELDGLSECVFNCNGRDVKYIDKAEVTFDQIVHSCGNVQRGYALGYCEELADLVWGDDCQYSCPYCKCTDKDASGTAESVEQIMRKKCYNCTCDEHKYDATYEGYIFDCDSTGSVSDAYQWKDFQCPMKYCIGNDDDKIDINDKWWANVAADAKCDKFCYCDTDAETTCVTGWSNILESENEGLVDSFNRECRGSLTACLDAPDRLFTTDVGPNCYDCPKCDCGIHAVDDKWWVEYEDEDELPGVTVCLQCQCYATGDTTNPSYASCGMEDVSYAKGTGDCPPTNTFKCHSEGGSYIDAEPTAPIVVGTTLTEEICYEGVELPSTWCSWNVQHDVEKEDGVIDSEDWGYSWGSCDNSIFCAIYGANDECFYADTSYSRSGCSGTSYTSTSREYIYCCNSDNCNHKDIDISKCTENKEYAEFMNEINQCQIDIYYSNDDCADVDKFKEEKTTCANVRSTYKDWMDCNCKMMSGMYKEASSDWKKEFEKQAKMLTGDGGGELSEWNEALGCNTNLLCNIKTGSVYDKADNKIYFVAAIFTAIVVMIIY